MPKKTQKNAFYFFMLDFKKEQQKCGIIYDSLADVAVAAGPEWKKATAEDKAHYEAKAQQEKERRQKPFSGLSCTGIPLADIEQQEKEEKEAIEYEKYDIQKMVRRKALNNSILDEDFFVMDVNYYCKSSYGYIIGESTIIHFNLRNGVQNSYHEMVNPGRIPMGYGSDAKMGGIELGLEMLDDSGCRSNYMKILANIVDYLTQNESKVTKLPPLFTMPDKVPAVKDFIYQMCQVSGEDETLFRVYRLDTLFYYLLNSIRRCSHEGFIKESMPLVELNADFFKYSQGLACEHHETNDKSNVCTSSRSKRWAFTILEICCPTVGIPLVPGQHVPLENSFQATFEYTNRDRGGQSKGPLCSCYKSTKNKTPQMEESKQESNENLTPTTSSKVTSLFEEDTTSSTKRTEPPLRLPNTDYSKYIRAPPRRAPTTRDPPTSAPPTRAPAPELTNEDFAALAISAGRGRGRLMAGIINKLNKN